MCAPAVLSLSPRADTHCTARAVPHPSEQGTLTLPWHGGRRQIICTDSTSPVCFPSEAIFTCLHWLLHGPNFKVRLQRTIFVSDPCGAAYFSDLPITALAI